MGVKNMQRTSFVKPFEKPWSCLTRRSIWLLLVEVTFRNKPTSEVLENVAIWLSIEHVDSHTPPRNHLKQLGIPTACRAGAACPCSWCCPSKHITDEVGAQAHSKIWRKLSWTPLGLYRFYRSTGKKSKAASLQVPRASLAYWLDLTKSMRSKHVQSTSTRSLPSDRSVFS